MSVRVVEDPALIYSHQIFQLLSVRAEIEKLTNGDRYHAICLYLPG